MNVFQRPYTSEADLPAILALKQRSTTPQNLYDQPTTGEMRRLLAPSPEGSTRTSEQPSWQNDLPGLSPEHRQRALTQRLTRLWEDASGQLVAYALIAQPGRSLTFQLHPQARGEGVEAEILAWGLAQMQRIARACGTPCDLWCRCRTVEQERRSGQIPTLVRARPAPGSFICDPFAADLVAARLLAQTWRHAGRVRCLPGVASGRV